jgi:alpha-D-xyloside xylohydrolase
MSTQSGSMDLTLTPVEPGIWRLRWGTPEPHTPTAYRMHPIKRDGLADLPGVDAPPIPADAFHAKQTARGLLISFPLPEDQDVYGLGLQLKSHRQTGKKKCLAINSDPVADTGDSHAPVPLLASTGGWAVYVDTLRYATFYCASHQRVNQAKLGINASRDIAITTDDLYSQRQVDQKQITIEIPHTQGVDLYLMAGPTMTHAIQRYNLFSGGGFLPPLWGLGVWYRTFGRFNQEQVLKLAGDLRERNLPCDVIGLEPGWQTKAYSCSFVWSDERFPNPAALIQQAREMGFKINLWEHVFTHPSSPMYEALLPHSGDHEVWEGLVPDLTLPQAFETFASYHDTQFVAQGIEGFKLDECDSSDFIQSPWSFPLSSQFPSGLDGEQMHSLLGMKYMHCIETVYRRHNRRTYSSVRSAHALAAPCPFALYSDLYDLPDFIRGVVNMGFSGLTWTPEVRDAKSVEDLIRRLQAVMLSPQALINAWYIPTPPWKQIDRALNNQGVVMDNWEQVEAVCREAMQLRMALVPYLYTAFADYQQTGLPPFRAMVMDWPDDPQTRTIDDQYMMGHDLLVAPILPGQHQRSVYLPAGQWYDFYSRTRYEGGQSITITPSLQQIPLFVKAGTLLPLANPVQHIEPDTVFEITLHRFGDNLRPARLIEDDGISFDFEQGQYNVITLTPDGQFIRVGRYPRHRYVLASTQATRTQGPSL